jgi:hypothetical protein
MTLKTIAKRLNMACPTRYPPYFKGPIAAFSSHEAAHRPEMRITMAGD